MLLQIITVARNAFVESIRQPIFFILVMLSGVTQLFNTWGTAFSMERDTTTAEVGSDDKLLLDVGLASVFVFGMILAAFISTAVVSREIEQKTVLTVVSKPISRAAVILGKYLGVAATMTVGVVAMMAFLLMSIRHGVMSTASDVLDMPVLVFTLGAVGVASAIGIWGNYFYGWYFSQTTVLIMAPLLVIAYILVLTVDKTWHFQELYRHIWVIDQDVYSAEDFLHHFGVDPPMSASQIEWTDFKPQITIACAIMAMSMYLLTAIATAVSTRLSQVMTIVVCFGIFVLGLLSNHLFGKQAFRNDPIAEVARVDIAGDGLTPLNERGGTVRVTLLGPPDDPIKPGDSIYYAPFANGTALMVDRFEPFAGDVTRQQDLYAPSTPPALIATDARSEEVTIKNVGARPVHITRPPVEGDFLFREPTRINIPALVVWTLIPNMHIYWQVDAISQNRPIPLSHVAWVGAYSVAQIGVFLSLGVTLFQRRDVG
jgi:hypothetical protein